MSKRWGNVINPDEIVEKFGADAMRVYEMFMGPFSQACAWNTNGLVGARKFLDKIFLLQEKVDLDYVDNKEVENLVHKTIKKVSEDIESFKLNTAVSTMMILINKIVEQNKISINNFENVLKTLSPFAPHLSEELWQKLGHKDSIFKEKWPEFDPEIAKDELITLVIQINGKVRDQIEVDADISEENAKEKALDSDIVQKWIDGKEVKKIVFVKGKLISIVI